LRDVATRALPIVVRLIVLGLPCWVSRAGFQISSRDRFHNKWSSDLPCWVCRAGYQISSRYHLCFIVLCVIWFFILLL